jgi:hypothetical protein
MEIGKRVPYGFQMAVRSYRRSYRSSQLQHKRTLTYCRGWFLWTLCTNIQIVPPELVRVHSKVAYKILPVVFNAKA